MKSQINISWLAPIKTAKNTDKENSDFLDLKISQICVSFFDDKDDDDGHLGDHFKLGVNVSDYM